MAEALKDKAVKDKQGHVKENLLPREVPAARTATKLWQLGVFQLPLDPSVLIGECECRKVFDSAQKPLWFRFKNELEDGPEVNIMFKVWSRPHDALTNSAATICARTC